MLYGITAGRGGGEGGGGGDKKADQAPNPARHPPYGDTPVQQQEPKKPYTGPLNWKAPPPFGPPYRPNVLPRLVLMYNRSKPYPEAPHMPVIASFGDKVAVSAGGSLAEVTPFEKVVPSLYFVCRAPQGGLRA
jgi:hypothetical protein